MVNHDVGPAPLDVTELRHTAGAFWRRIDAVAETGSTNADLLARAAAGEDIDGCALIADYQSAGRGRHGRRWAAPPRSQVSLSAGVSLEGVPPAEWGWLPLVTGLAVVEALDETTGVAARLKWPNDVLVGDGKLAGILAEVAAPVPAVVVGIGLNVTMTAAEAPDPNATSLRMLGAAVTERQAIAAAVLRHLGARLAAWRAAGGHDAQLVDGYRARSCTLGTRVRATMPGERVVEGIAQAVDALGRLRIDTGADEVTVSAGDITHLRRLDDAPGR